LSAFLSNRYLNYCPDAVLNAPYASPFDISSNVDGFNSCFAFFISDFILFSREL
jgi:hypothetical protein